MKHWILTLISLLLIEEQAFAQKDNAEFEKRMKMETQIENYDWVYRNIFVDYKIGAVNEFFVPKNKIYLYGKFDSPTSTVPSDTMTVIDAGYMISIFNYTFEPRMNILNFRKYSLMLKSPLSLGFSVFSEAQKGTLSKKSGFFNMNLPLLVGICSGLNSNFTNSSKRGFALSAGYQLMLAPVVGGRPQFTNFNYLEPLGEAYKKRKTWGIPIVQIDLYQLKKSSRIRGYSLAFSPSKQFYFKFAISYVLTKK